MNVTRPDISLPGMAGQVDRWLGHLRTGSRAQQLVCRALVRASLDDLEAYRDEAVRLFNGMGRCQQHHVRHSAAVPSGFWPDNG